MKQIFELKKLSSVCDIVSDSPKEFIGIKNYYSTGAINNESYNIVAEEVTFLNRPSRANSYPKLNDIGFAKMKFTNKVILVDNFFDGSIFSTGFCFLRPKNTLDSRYLYHFVISHLFQTVKDLQAGDGIMGGIKNSDVKDIEIPLPPLQEQQRIVAILDEAFAALAKAKFNAEQNLKNSKELFESYLQGVFEKGNWDTKTIAEVCDEIFAGGDAPKNNFSLEENEKYKIPIYANAVKYRGLYGYTDTARVTKPSITISARGSGTGHTEIRFDKYLPIVRLIVLIPNLSLINLEFLKHSIDNLDILRSGSAIPQLTVPMIKEYNLPLPSLEQQKIIVQKLTILENETQKLEEIYNQKINDLDELKKSVLQKAFSGELKTEKIVV